MVYLTSIFGGIAADRFLGTHKSMLWGGWIIALGHITLAMTEFFHIPGGEAVMLGNAPGALMTFLIGLTLIIIGTGFFKPCVSVMVGQLYTENDPRRDSGFTLFYMGINIGAMLSPLIAGYPGREGRLALGLRRRGGGHDRGHHRPTSSSARSSSPASAWHPDRSDKGKGTADGFVGICGLTWRIPRPINRSSSSSASARCSRSWTRGRGSMVFFWAPSAAAGVIGG